MIRPTTTDPFIFLNTLQCSGLLGGWQLSHSNAWMFFLYLLLSTKDGYLREKSGWVPFCQSVIAVPHLGFKLATSKWQTQLPQCWPTHRQLFLWKKNFAPCGWSLPAGFSSEGLFPVSPPSSEPVQCSPPPRLRPVTGTGGQSNRRPLHTRFKHKHRQGNRPSSSTQPPKNVK